MGKGDMKTRRGKIVAGSYGVSRKRKKKNAIPAKPAAIAEPTPLPVEAAKKEKPAKEKAKKVEEPKAELTEQTAEPLAEPEKKAKKKTESKPDEAEPAAEE